MGILCCGFHLEKIRLRLGDVTLGSSPVSFAVWQTTPKLSGTTQQLIVLFTNREFGRARQERLVSALQVSTCVCQVEQENSLPTWPTHRAGTWLLVVALGFSQRPQFFRHGSPFGASLGFLIVWQLGSKKDCSERDWKGKLPILWSLGPETFMASLLSYFIGQAVTGSAQMQVEGT